MQTIKIACQTNGSAPYQREVEGEIFGSWAAHDSLNGLGFKVTFVRFGLAVPFEFEGMEAACAAAREIDALKAAWNTVDHAGIRSIGKALAEICERHGGERIGTAVFRGEPDPVDSLPDTPPSTQRATVTW